MKSQRNYGIDLLRIVSMIMIVAIHVIEQGGILEATESSFMKRTIVEAMFFFACYGTVCFALISGYVNYGRTFKYSNLFYLIIQTTFYSIIICFLFRCMFPDKVNGFSLMQAIFPVPYRAYWYITVYAGVCVLIPVINYSLERMSFSLSTAFAVISFITFMVIPFVFMSGLYYGSDIFGESFGHSVFIIALLYYLGAYYRKYAVHKRIRCRYFAFIVLLCTFIGLLLCILVRRFLKQNLYGILINCESPFILIGASALLLLFARLNFGSIAVKVVSFFAPAAFGVYLVHMQPLVYNEIIKDGFVWIADYNTLLMLLMILGISVGIWLLASLIDHIRICLFELLCIKKLSIKIENICKMILRRIIKKLEEMVIVDDE